MIQDIQIVDDENTNASRQQEKSLKLPVLVDRLDSPLELGFQSLGEDFVDGDVKLPAEDNRETRINIVLSWLLAVIV